jgi:DNA repair exonuclease SbcCD ATPase subunit
MGSVSSTVKENSELVKAIEAAGVSASTSETLLVSFGGHFCDMQEATSKAANIVVTDENQTAAMKAAKVARLEIKKVRTATEATRKMVKEDALRFGKAVDAVAGMIRVECEKVETRLEECETYAERAEIKRSEVRRIDRATALMPFGTDTRYHDLGGMSDDAWNNLYTREREAFEGRQAKAKADAEAAAAAEAERRANELRLVKENAKLKAEAAERELKARAEREAHEAEMREERAKIDAERAEADRIMQEAKEAQAATEAAERAQAAAEQAKQEAEERAARALEDAPDAAKLRDVAERLRAFEFPAVGPRAVSVVARIREANVKAAAWVDQMAAVLEGGAK